MSRGLEKDLLFYQRELTYLREAGRTFAQRYPKIAHRLDYNSTESADPHVERLLESFAFLTAQLQEDIEDQFPRLSASLLQALYPQFINPVPPMSVVHFQADPARGTMTTMAPIPRQTPVFAQSESGDVCRFSTCYDVELWPVIVSQSTFIAAEDLPFDTPGAVSTYLKIDLAAPETPFSKLNISSLKFYIDLERTSAQNLYSLLMLMEDDVYILPDGASQPIHLSSKNVAPVGFDDSEAVLPYPSHTHVAYRLLQEFFVFPEKYNFFTLSGLDFSSCDKALSLFFPIRDKAQTRHIHLAPDGLRLGCAPVINLFSKISEPLNVTHTQVEYRLSPDQRREMTTEIYAIDNLYIAGAAGEKARYIAPYFSFGQREQESSQTRYWVTRRVPCLLPETPGSDILLSFVDTDARPAEAKFETAYAQIWCTNRMLATQVPAGAEMTTELPLPAHIRLLAQPTSPVPSPSDGSTQWRLISQLSLNHLSLSNAPASLLALKGIMELYPGSERPQAQTAIQGISALTCTSTVRRISAQAWRGFMTGTAVTVTCDATQLNIGESFLFASVLNEFLGLYAAINSFTELTLKTTDREIIWKTWPLNFGRQSLL